MLRWGSLGLKGAELPDLSPFRVVVDAMHGIPAPLIDSGPFVSVHVVCNLCLSYTYNICTCTLHCAFSP